MVVIFDNFSLKIGNEENPNVAVDNTHDILIKGKVVEGLTETEDLLNTPYATEITENFSPTAGESSYKYSHDIDPFRRKISKSQMLKFNCENYTNSNFSLVN